MKLKCTTPICKICFKDIKFDNFHSIIRKPLICNKCIKNMNPVLKNFYIDDVKGLTLYEYNEELKKLIYLYKGNKDYELKDVFISNYAVYLNFLFKDYEIIYVPSSKEKIEERGFDHCREMFSLLKMKENSKAIKLKNDKQSSKNFNDRKNNKGEFKLLNPELIKNKKILLVDDVCTTGSTLKEMVRIIKENKPQDIKILVISKREFSKEEIKHLKNKDIVLK